MRTLLPKLIIFQTQPIVKIMQLTSKPMASVWTECCWANYYINLQGEIVKYVIYAKVQCTGSIYLLYGRDDSFITGCTDPCIYIWVDESILEFAITTKKWECRANSTVKDLWNQHFTLLSWLLKKYNNTIAQEDYLLKWLKTQQLGLR